MPDRHTIYINEFDLFWCEDEDCISDDCTDYDRCSNGCVCNIKDNNNTEGM